MAKLDNLRRIMAEDFPKEDRQTISILGGVLNQFMRQVIDGFNKNINFDNLNQEVLTFRIYVDSSGNPVTEAATSTTLKIKLGKARRVIGINAINTVNRTTSTNYPTSNPFVSFSVSNGIMTVNNIQGLQANEQYEITVLVIYSD